MRRRTVLRRSLGMLLGGTLLAAGLVAVEAPTAQAAYAAPATPSGLPRALEPIQPYIGQSTCQPAAKPGVAAFRNLLLRTYRDTGSLGISRDCGAGGQSEHKEGRAFDWKVNYYNARQRGEANTLLSWLLKTDAYGNKAAMARRLGIMYVIWNRQIWKAYDPRGWQPYHGPNPHRDHVHFSFGWAGARQVTSYWDRTVAPLDFGPHPPAHITPVRKVSNIALVRQYGGTTLALPTSGTAVRLVQAALKLPVDGDYGSDTAAAVAKFQVDQRLVPTQRFTRAEWKALFPPPVTPFGGVDATRSALGNLLVTGWAIDADTTSPITVTATLDGVSVGSTAAALTRDDVAKAYPEYGGAHGFSFAIPAVDGPHRLCVTAVNAPGTPGVNALVGGTCLTASLTHDPVGALEGVRQDLGLVHVTGWALDPDTVDPVVTRLIVDGNDSPVVPTQTTRPDIGLRWPGLGDLHGVAADLALDEGPHTVCLTAADLVAPGTDKQLGCRSVTVRHTPVGALDLVRRGPDGVLVQGWGLDPDTTGPVTTGVTVDGTVVSTPSANLVRTGLPATWARTGTAHGFTTVLDLATGTHTVCVVLHDAVAPGADTQLPCRSVTVSHEPAGLVTVLRNRPATGAVLVAGDAFDPDAAGPTTVVPVVDGRSGTPITAGRTSATAASRWPGYGSAHGFATTLILRSGSHQVCMRVINVVGTPGVDHPMGCRTVVVSNAVGRLTAKAVYPRTAVVSGWALDLDRSTASTFLVTVDGRARYWGPAALRTSAPTAVYPGYGTAHGFKAAVRVTRGTHRVCVVARNTAGTPGSSTVLGCRSLSFA